jgi:hypothetical protein
MPRSLDVRQVISDHRLIFHYSNLGVSRSERKTSQMRDGSHSDIP